MTAFHDTFFAYILRLAFGSRVFSYPDEIVLPTIWQDRWQLTSQVSPGNSIQPKLDDAPNLDVTSVLSETAVIANTPRTTNPEKDQDPLLIGWDGPTDPDVSCWWGRLHCSCLQVCNTRIR
jgi:hypothetical protein